MVISVPSFWERYTSALVTPSSFRLYAKPSVKRSATRYRAAFRIVAFSRSIRPMLPISLEMEMCTSPPMTSRQICAARSSCSAHTVENTQEMATDSTRPFRPSKNARAAASSRGLSAFPSYS